VKPDRDKNIEKVFHLYRTKFNITFLVLHDFTDCITKIAYNKNNSINKEDLAMVVTAAEFKANFGKYLELITNEDIFITRNGKTVAKVVNPQVTAVDFLRGMLDGNSSGVDVDSLREERLLKYENNV